MPRTPDRSVQATEYNDESVYEDFGLPDPTIAGTIRYRSTAFRVADGVGVFDLRRPWLDALNGPSSDVAGRVLYKTVTGTVLPSQVAWYSDAAKTKLVTLVSYAYSTTVPVLPVTITYKLYNTDGTVRAQCVDQISYAGVFETGRVRTFS